MLWCWNKLRCALHHFTTYYYCCSCRIKVALAVCLKHRHNTSNRKTDQYICRVFRLILYEVTFDPDALLPHPKTAEFHFYSKWNSRKSVRWSAVSVAPMWVYVMWDGERGSGPEGADDLCLVSFEAEGLNLSHEAVIWTMRLWYEAGVCASSHEAVIWASKLWFELLGCDLSLKAVIEPQVWYLRLEAGIWGFRLGYQPQGWDLSI